MTGRVTNKFPFEFHLLESEDIVKIKRNFNADFEFSRVGPKGYVMSADYEADADNIYKMPIKPGDIFVCSFPRSGTTWTQELVWLLAKDLDYSAARSTPLTSRYTFLELPSLITKKAIDDSIKLDKSNSMEVNNVFLESFGKHSLELLASCPSPRFFKTHLPSSFLPPTTIDTAKMVYIARDPRDVAVSFYHQNKMFTFINYKGDFKTYWNFFMQNLILFTPYFEHLKESWALRHHPNMLFMFYEELSKDLPAAVRRVADFLGKQISEEQISSLCEHLSFKNFKKNDSVNAIELQELGLMQGNDTFIRKGKAGGWREYFDEQMREEAERWIAHNLQGSDLSFPHH